MRFLPRLPDSIVLFTDGLPTRSDSLPMEGDVDEGHRIRFFEIATSNFHRAFRSARSCSPC